jgi:membrane protein implicated in regulation of membrane protease activity
MAEKEDIDLLKVKALIELKKIDAANSAKEVSSKYIGKTAIPWIVLLVIVGVASSAFLPSESLPAVIGLVSTAVMALITMLTSITGTKEKEEKPEFKVINELINKLEAANEPLSVNVSGDSVTVKKGDDTFRNSRETTK